MVIDLGSGFHFRPRQRFAKTKFFSLIPTATKSRRLTRILTNPLSKKFTNAQNIARRFYMKPKSFGKNAAPDFMKTRPTITRFSAAAKSKACISPTAFRGHGVMHSPATGRALSEIILDGEASFLDVSLFEFGKICKTGELLHETAFI